MGFIVYSYESGDELKEKEIIQGLRNGKSEYVEFVVVSYYEEVFHYLCRKLGDVTEAQDLTQDVFLRFFTKLYLYQDKGKLRNYLLKIATNLSNDIFRKIKPTIPIEQYFDIPDGEKTPLERVETEELKSEVNTALQMLTLEQREVIILRFYHDLSFKDIARITDANLSTVKSRYRRGMETLKKRLEVNYEK